ncbi:MAG TPA: ABC transporter substrate-binding protein [Syntrophomonadaceae bacterium]|nr:ABC transporter substrate-binding protein [Syntrophomonadaceae bacterium]
MKNHIRLMISYIIMLGLLLTLFSGCSKSPAPKNVNEAGTPVDGGTLNVALESQTDVLDPHLATGWVSYRVLNQMYEGLVKEDLSGQSSSGDNVIPALAKSWDVSADGRVFTFYLREDVKFHDGTPFNAEAVKYNFQRMYKKDAPNYNSQAASLTSYIWKYLKSIEVIAPLTIRLNFSTPFYEFPKVLAQIGMGSGGIISPAALQKWGDAIGEHPVGTGPFRFLRRSGDKIILVKNNAYWGNKAHLDKIVFWQMPDPYARVNALQTGLVDLIFVPPPETIDDLVKAGFLLTQGTTAHIWFLSLNTREPVFQDIRVRRAIAMAIDKEKIAADLKNTVKPAQGLQAPGNTSFDPDYKGLPFDPVQAKELLAAAGYPSGFDTILQTSVSGSGQILPVQIAKDIQYDLHKLGINVKIETYEWIKYIGVWANGMRPGVGINQFSWGMTANYWLQMITRSDFTPPNGYNTNYYNNRTVDFIFERALKESNARKRALLYRQADELIVNDAWHIPIVNDLAPLIMSPEVKDLKHTTSEWYDFKLVWINRQR